MVPRPVQCAAVCKQSWQLHLLAKGTSKFHAWDQLAAHVMQHMQRVAQSLPAQGHTEEGRAACCGRDVHTRRCSRCSSSHVSRPTMKCGALADAMRSGATYSPNGSSSFRAASCTVHPGQEYHPTVLWAAHTPMCGALSAVPRWGIAMTRVGEGMVGRRERLTRRRSALKHMGHSLLRCAHCMIHCRWKRCLRDIVQQHDRDHCPRQQQGRGCLGFRCSHDKAYQTSIFCRLVSIQKH